MSYKLPAGIVGAFVAFACFVSIWRLPANTPRSPIFFNLKSIPFRLENAETESRHLPATMAGGVAVFDYNNDGRPDIFFTNGANLATLKKDDPKYSNRLFRNDGNGVFTDVTRQAGLSGSGYDMGVAVGDFNNDGHPDLFVAGVHRNSLYRNNGDGTFTDVTEKAGLNRPDPKFGPHWGVTAAWVDVNNDGLLDLFVVNYVQWNYENEPKCWHENLSEYCNPRSYQGLPNELYLNKGDGTFEDVSEKWGVRASIGKGMGVGVADYDHDGFPDIFVANDTFYTFLFHNISGKKFEEAAFPLGVALPEDGNFIGGMGLDFRDFDNDGYPDIAYVALSKQTFPLLKNMNGREFREVTTESGMRALTLTMSAFGVGIYDLDNDGWKDLFITRGDAVSRPLPGTVVDQPNSVFRNLGTSGKWQALTEEAGLTAVPPARNRGCAFGDLDGDGRVDVVATALAQPAQIWMNASEGSGHWLDFALEGTKSNRDGIGATIKVTSKSLTQYNHMTTSFCYASSSDVPVHFGLGADDKASAVEIRWPSGTVQKLENVAADRLVRVKEPK